MSQTGTQAPRWMKITLIAAAVYNIAWGAFIVLFPLELFRWLNMPLPNYPQLWQCIGMIVGVYGIGYAIAASDPFRHWPIVLVGLLGKIFGPLGFLVAAARGELSPAFGVTLLTNDLIWWLPFGLVLHRVYQAFLDEQERAQRAALPDLLDRFHTRHGDSLASMSQAAPVMLVFLRHFG